MSNPRRSTLVTAIVESDPRAGEATPSASQALKRPGVADEIASERTLSGLGLG